MQKLSPLAKVLFSCEIFFFVILPLCLIASVLSGAFLVTALSFVIGLCGLILAFVQSLTQSLNTPRDFENAVAELWAYHQAIFRRIGRCMAASWQWLGRLLSHPIWVILAVLLLIMGSLIGYRLGMNKPQTTVVHPVLPTPTAKITDLHYLADGQPVGLSDGSNVFDLGPLSGSPAQRQYYRTLKREGADAFKKGNILLARQDWSEATSQQYYPNDAETLIYLEDLNVNASSNPYITFVFVTQLTGSQSAINRGRDDLQGAYVALKEFNSRKNAHVLARLWIANIGDQDTGIGLVKNSILQLASNKGLEPTFAGVLGWPERTDEVDEALSEICKSNIPIVTISSAIDPNAKSACDFSVAPLSNTQAEAAADFAATRLHARRAAIIYDSANTYSKNMAELFSSYFTKNSSVRRIIDKENYTLGNGVALGGLVRAALRGEPDVIYFVGYPDDIKEVFQELQKERVVINVLSTDILYQAPHYASATNAISSHLYFTAFAYPDEWSLFHLSQQPVFVDDYKSYFDPDHVHSKDTYGFERADNDALIAYDAMCTVLEASQSVLGTDKTSESPQELLQALPGVKFQGISGLIQFDARGNAVNKAVIVVSVNAADERGYAFYIRGSYICSECTQFLQGVGGQQ